MFVIRRATTSTGASLLRQRLLSQSCLQSHRHYSVAAASAQAYFERLSNLSPSERAEGDEANDTHIGLLTLNRPAAKNAISQQMLAELDEAIEGVKKDSSVRVLVLRSAVEKTFCAGADLKERKGMSISEVEQFLARLRKVFTNLSKLPCPTITALDGLAMGGGMELALCTDIRVGSANANRLGLTETKLGIIPGAGGTHRMTRLIGPSKTKDLVFTGRLVDSNEAHSLGILDHLATSSALKDSISLARQMARNGPIALQAAKQAIEKGQSLDTETALDWERACYDRCIGTKDRLEGLKAFAEKRPPVYKGE